MTFTFLQCCHVQPEDIHGLYRHNEVKDITASLLIEVYHDVVIEPHLQPITGELMAHRTANTDDQSQLDIAASGIW